jgi:hypothetical protein
MIQPLPTFMAAQRTQCTINSNKQYCSSSQSWTAGRCQRLLRPITSRIEILKKDSIRYTAAGNPDSIQTQTTPATAPSNTSVDVSRECEEEDEYWAKGRKRVRRTYSARSKLQDVSHTDQIPGSLKEQEGGNPGPKVRLQPGEFLVPTPILKRSKSLVVDSSQKLLLGLSFPTPPKSKNVKRSRSRYATNDGEAHFEVAETMRRIKKTTHAARFKLYEGICNSLEALFKATILQEEQVPMSECDNKRSQLNTFSPASKFPNSRSLFSMCLRGVPNYIKEEEKRFTIEAEAIGQKSAFDTPMASTETYADLESLGTSETGWKHLKTVVRAHGVLVISDAIKDSLLDADIASALVMLCVYASLPDEAETLLTSLLKACIYPDPKSPQSQFHDDPTLLPLLTLERFVKYTGRVCYYHRQIANIITNGSLSVTWLGTKRFASVWTSLFRSLSTDPFDRDAIKFMTDVLPFLYGAQSSKFEKNEYSSSDQNSMLSVLDTTRTSVLTALLAMSTLSISHTNISQTLKATIIDCQLAPSELHSHGGALILMANLLGDAEIEEDTSFLKQLVRLLGSKPYQLLNPLHPSDHIPSFLYSVARCCGRGFSGDGFEHLQIILERLMAIASLDHSDGARVLEQIVVDSAFIFADQLPDSKHMQYAQYIRTHMHSSFIPPKISPAKGEPKSQPGFRWEEGINEWVMATPAVRLKGVEERGASPAGEDSDCDTPTRSGQRLCKSETALHKRGRVLSNRYARISDLAPDSPKECDEEIYSQVRKDYETQGESIRTHYPLQKLPTLTRPRSSRRPITKMRRFGYEPLRSSQNWILFEYSDDELNSTTATSSDSAQAALQELPNSMRCFRNVPQKTKSTFHKLSEGRDGYLEEQSEDELGL